MKLLSVAIPSYNSEAYLANCLESVLIAEKDVEIIVINDGSSDLTAAIADSYQNAYPDTIKVIHQENRGHGEAINAGLKAATGLYFKVLDSDDWFDAPSFLKLIKQIRKFKEDKVFPNAIVCNYVYENQARKHKKVISYRNVFPKNQICTWDNLASFHKGQYLLMHSLVYEREFLLSTDLELPHHTFYVDNLFAFVPMQYLESFYYMDIDLYRYFIGRSDQSVQEKTMIRRIDQQLRVNRMMLEAVDFNKLKYKRQKEYLFNYFEIITAVSCILLTISGTTADLRKRKELFELIKYHDSELYRKFRRGIIGQAFHIKGKLGKTIVVSAYRILQRIFGFN